MYIGMRGAGYLRGVEYFHSEVMVLVSLLCSPSGPHFTHWSNFHCPLWMWFCLKPYVWAHSCTDRIANVWRKTNKWRLPDIKRQEKHNVHIWGSGKSNLFNTFSALIWGFIDFWHWRIIKSNAMLIYFKFTTKHQNLRGIFSGCLHFCRRLLAFPVVSPRSTAHFIQRCGSFALCCCYSDQVPSLQVVWLSTGYARKTCTLNQAVRCNGVRICHSVSSTSERRLQFKA